jgi:hypothetical protein
LLAQWQRQRIPDSHAFPADTSNMKWESCIGLRTTTQPCWLRSLATGRIGVLGSCLTKLKNELHRQQEGEFIETEKYKAEEQSPWWGGGEECPKSGCWRIDIV